MQQRVPAAKNGAPNKHSGTQTRAQRNLKLCTDAWKMQASFIAGRRRGSGLGVLPLGNPLLTICVGHAPRSLVFKAIGRRTNPVAFVDDVELIGAQLRRMRDTTSVAELEYFFA